MLIRSAPFLDGWHAHRLIGAPMPENPYSEGTQPYSHHQYIAGWCERFNAIKHDLPLTHDAMFAEGI
jgi:hypothetical protein